MFGISQSVRSRAVQVCTPELFHQATRSGRVKEVCAHIREALGRKQRGEISQEEYDKVKTQWKAQLPILTPHATFKNGRRVNADAIPSGLSIYDKDHIENPRQYWEEKMEILKRIKIAEVSSKDDSQKDESSKDDSSKESSFISVFDLILLVHVTPSSEGLRLVFVMPQGMNLAEAQKWMSEQLADDDYDSCVKDLARPSFLVPEDYILYINEEELFKERDSSQIPVISQFSPNSSKSSPILPSSPSPNSSGSSLNPPSQNFQPSNSSTSYDETNRLSGSSSHPALPVAAIVQSSQPADSHAVDDAHIGADVFPTEYDGIPYKTLTGKLVELLGGEPQHGSRNSFIFSLACYLRYLCDDNAAWIKQVIPTFGEEQKRAFTTVDSACQRKQNHRMPMVVQRAVKLCHDEMARGKAENYDGDDFGDISNPDSYFYRIHEMPRKLPKLIKLLISKTPRIYQPAVSQAVFPALGAHLCDTRFLYIDNVEHEATLMSILCAPTGSGKECITQPINRIMADIRMRDAEQRERERKWKDECNRKGSNKDKRERPEGLVIQEVNIDMTNPAFVLRMKEAEGHFLYAKVNELNLFDALKGKTNQHFRIMELAFDLGNYGQDRVGTQSVTETVKVRFNWNACCTPKKCRDYFRRVVTDGPISRISFATIERRACGSEMPVYGTYDAAFDEALKPYIDNLLKARGLVNCPQALRLARQLVEENADFARLSQNFVFENLSFRANVIAYLKACVLYVANGMKWEKSIEDFVRWSERYDLWCKLKLFGQLIYDADCEQNTVSKTAPTGPQNLLQLLPDEFTVEDYVKVRRAQGYDDDNKRRIQVALNQWVHRGYVARMEVAKDGSARNGTSEQSSGLITDYDYSSVFRKLKFLKGK